MNSVGAICRISEYCFTIFHNDKYGKEDIDVEICEAVMTIDYFRLFSRKGCCSPST